MNEQEVHSFVVQWMTVKFHTREIVKPRKALHVFMFSSHTPVLTKPMSTVGIKSL